MNLNVLVLDTSRIDPKWDDLVATLGQYGYCRAHRGMLFRRIAQPPSFYRVPGHLSQTMGLARSDKFRAFRNDPLFEQGLPTVHLGEDYLWLFAYSYLCDTQTPGSRTHGLLTYNEAVALADQLGMISVEGKTMAALELAKEQVSVPGLVMKLYEAIVPIVARRARYKPFERWLTEVQAGMVSLSHLESLYKVFARQPDKATWDRLIVRIVCSYRQSADKTILTERLSEHGLAALFQPA